PILQRARDLHEKFAPALARHSTIPGLLGRYTDAIDRTSRRTVDLGVPAFCIACARRDGVCCFKGVERRYDEYLLLENMLLGDSGVWGAGSGTSCYFCGASGCSLKAKSSFCLNYYCPEIKRGLGAGAMDVLCRQVGRELGSQWELERVMMPWLWARAKTGLPMTDLP
ncbi:MAG: hypothetical protein M0P73_18765, partial [Syntrophobacterales bacterium]|nr:hypothetical protein [Syntrophobacterales bacterium]